MIKSLTFEKILKASDVTDPFVALDRPFFRGIKIYKDEYNIHNTVVYSSAFTDRQMMERLKDDKFCTFCFMLSHEHDYKCRKSPWKNWGDFI